MNVTIQTIMIMIAGVLAVAIVTGIVRGQTSGLNDFSDDNRETSGCGITKQQFCLATGGSGNLGPRATKIAKDNTDCGWSSGGGTSPSNVCG